MKQITHTIGGKEVTLDVGKMWFSKFYGEATSSDPLLMSELLSKPDKQFDFICGLVYGGLNCFNKVNGIKEFISIEQVQDWVGAMDESDAASLINKFVEANKPKEQGEAPAQVANP
jgi:hypothetical protein